MHDPTPTQHHFVGLAFRNGVHCDNSNNQHERYLGGGGAGRGRQGSATSLLYLEF